MEKIKVKLQTESNLIIGGTPNSFEIGGVDMEAVLDYKGDPCIPASSLKGILRRIVRELQEEENSDSNSNDDSITIWITNLYKNHFNYLLNEINKQAISEEKLQKTKESLEEIRDHCSAEYLFGIQKVNRSPKFIFNDLQLKKEKDKKKKDIFSIDTKNAITLNNDDTVSSNPRTYKTIRPEVTFLGEIWFQGSEQLCKGNSEVSKEDVEKKILELLEKVFGELNLGIYRMGNSGSRGYGRVHIDIVKGE